jgi:hypothetical protein
MVNNKKKSDTNVSMDICKYHSSKETAVTMPKMMPGKNFTSHFNRELPNRIISRHSSRPCLVLLNSFFCEMEKQKTPTKLMIHHKWIRKMAKRNNQKQQRQMFHQAMTYTSGDEHKIREKLFTPDYRFFNVTFFL